MINPKKIVLDVMSLSSEKPDPDIDTSDLMEDAYKEYKIVEIVSNVGEDGFEHSYKLFLDDIKHEPFLKQKQFLELLIVKICSMYDIEFMRVLSIDNDFDLKECYAFVEFFMFDYVQFYAYVWNEMTDWTILHEVNVEKYVSDNPFGFLKSIDKIILTYELPRLYKELFLSLPGAKLLDLFIKFTNREKKNITLAVIEINMDYLLGRREVDVKD
jgi:hypothetical protein